jgi:hypothetical protein
MDGREDGMPSVSVAPVSTQTLRPRPTSTRQGHKKNGRGWTKLCVGRAQGRISGLGPAVRPCKQRACVGRTEGHLMDEE